VRGKSTLACSRRNSRPSEENREPTVVAAPPGVRTDPRPIVDQVEGTKPGQKATQIPESEKKITGGISSLSKLEKKREDPLM